MSVLVLQVIIKQWDKSQRTAEHERLRVNIPDKYPLISPPAVYVFDKHCVIDQHGDDIQGNRVKIFKDDDRIKLDRFQIDADHNLEYYGAQSQQSPLRIGSLNNQWIQCKYNCRYSIFESDQFYWLYEELIFNAIWVNKLNENVFLNTVPAIIYADFNEFDKRKKL